MQYPIIDSITQAYINNGWTGLDFKFSNNLIYFPTLSNTSSNGVSFNIINDRNTLSITGTATASVTNAYNSNLSNTYNLMPLGTYPSGTYTIASFGFIGTSTSDRLVFTARYSDNTLITGTGIRIGGTGSSPITFVANNPFKCGFYINIERNSIMDCEVNVQMQHGSELSNYEPYSPLLTNIFSRMKLPLPHYFPHPVIDALQRAAAGTQTADDTEILQHYLTPLGIGGI